LGDRNLELLEFHKIREILAGYTSFSASRELALDLVPLSNEEDVRLRLRQSAEARRLLSLSPDFHIGDVVDIREVVKMAARGKILDTKFLLEIQKTLAATRGVKRHLMNMPQELPLLSGLAEDIVALDHIEKDIDNCLSPNGDLLDTASPKLASVRRRMREVRQELLTHLQAIVTSPRGRRIAQEPIVTEREGRYVIPVKVECRRQIRGIVHDVSNTEATVFIEPWTTTETQNELRELVAGEKDEVERILKTLSAEAGAFESEISRNIELVAELDLALAKARYARDARATEPVMVAAVRGTREEADEPG
jgi:DNA mismatch repair protein MutS2